MLVPGPIGCSHYIGTTAASYLRRVREDPDPNIRYVAYAKLAQPACYETPQQKSEAVKTLIDKLQKGHEPQASRAVIIRTLGALGDPAAREEVVKAVSDPEPVVRVEACRALGKVGQPEDATVLTRVMTVDTLEDCRIAAIEALGVLKPKDARITRVLVAAMEHDDPATRLASLQALRKITGRDLGVEPGPWQKLLDPEPGPTPGSAESAVVAAPTAPPVSNAPSYPPRPTPPPPIDPQTRSVGLPPSATTPVPSNLGPGAGNYPVHNPNLTPSPAGR